MNATPLRRAELEWPPAATAASASTAATLARPGTPRTAISTDRSSSVGTASRVKPDTSVNRYACAAPALSPPAACAASASVASTENSTATTPIAIVTRHWRRRNLAITGLGDEPTARVPGRRQQRAAEDPATEQDQRAVERRVEQRAQPAAVGERAGRRGHGGADHRGPHPERERALDRVRRRPRPCASPGRTSPRERRRSGLGAECRRAVAGHGRAHDDTMRGRQPQRAQRPIQRFAERDLDRRRRPVQ